MPKVAVVEGLLVIAVVIASVLLADRLSPIAGLRAGTYEATSSSLASRPTEPEAEVGPVGYIETAQERAA